MIGGPQRLDHIQTDRMYHLTDETFYDAKSVRGDTATISDLLEY